MHTRDLTLQCPLPQQELHNKLFEMLQKTGRMTQGGKTDQATPSYYLVQPEDTLVLIPPPVSLSSGSQTLYTYQVRIQPYNLPDLSDQIAMLQNFAINFYTQIQQHFPHWKLELHDIV